MAEALERHRAVVVVAEPGAGKTTRVPPMLEERFGGTVVCTQPRRLAARMAASYVARSRDEAVGESVGYRVRHDARASTRTALSYETEGLTLRRYLQGDAGEELTLVIDELHERGLESDALLALAARDRNQPGGPRLAVMSATLDAERVAAFLGDCPIVRAAGRVHPVTVEHLPPEHNRTLEAEVARGLGRVLREQETGHILVFLPGVAEIRRAAQHCKDLADRADLAVVALHGSLPSTEQDRALAPRGRRKLILATNIAETSLTIDGVEAVIDSGLARVARHSPWSGLRSLQIENISQASAEQRAGRAGRTRPGLCLRLYGAQDLRARRPFDPPAIARSDLSELVLMLEASRRSLIDLDWLDPPPEEALRSARELLRDLGALSGSQVTDIGRALARLSAHPRLARTAIEGHHLGVGAAACKVAALLSERPLRFSMRRGEAAAVETDGDVLDDLDIIERCHGSSELRRADADPAVAKAVDKAARSLSKQLGTGDEHGPGDERDCLLRRAILAGFPDRVARRREAGGAELLLADGGGAVLSPASGVRDSLFLIALDVEARGRARDRQVKVRSAVAVDPDWLVDLEGAHATDEVVFDRALGRVVKRSAIHYRALCLDESLITDPARIDAGEAAMALANAAWDLGLESLVDADTLSREQRRVEFAHQHGDPDSLPKLGTRELKAAVHDAAHAVRSLAELRNFDLIGAAKSKWSGQQKRQLDRLAPTAVSIPGRTRVVVHYEADRPPWIESRLQDFFGSKAGPSVAAGAVPLVLHLLAPNQRAVQVTTDLQNFWREHYPKLRKQLSRRYPKHDWPQDPLAERPRRGRKR